MGNLVADGQKEYEFFKWVLDYLEQCQLYGAADKRTRLANEFFEYCKTHDGQRSAHFKLVPAKFRDEFEQRLMDANLPFAVMSDGRGNYAFMTRDIDAKEFLEIQMDIFKGHTEYYKELNLEEFLNREYRDNTDVLTMQFNSKEELEMFRNKSYENGKGFVIATEEMDGKFIAYASMKDAVSDGFHTDIPSTILRMQGDMSGIGAEFKKSQVTYDLQVKEEIMSRIKHGDSFTIMNGYDNKDSYIEVVGGELKFMEYNPESGMFNNVLTPVSVPTNWNDEKEVKAFEDALSVQLAKVKNKKIMAPEQFRSFMTMTPNEMKEYAYKAQVKAFEEPGKSGVCRPFCGKEFMREYQTDLETQRKEIMKSIKDELAELDEMQKELDNLEKSVSIHPDQSLLDALEQKKYEIAAKETRIEAKKEDMDTLSEKIKSIQLFKNHKERMDKAMESVVTAAHARIVHSPDYKLATDKEKEEMLEEAMLTILRTRNTPELVALTKFLEDNGILHEYDELVANVESEFHDNINVERIDKLKDALEKKKEEKEAEAEKEKDDTEQKR